MEIVQEAIKVKSHRCPGYARSISSLVNRLKEIESDFEVVLKTTHVTDIFWDNFISICIDRGLMLSSIETICNQLRSILNWAVKHGAEVSPTYKDFRVPKATNRQIALTADEVSRIYYFDIDRFYPKRRSDYREKMLRVRDMFVLSVCLFQRHSDMIRISRSCFDRNIFRITQQKTGSRAVVNIDKYSTNPKAAYDILERYNYEAPYKGDIGNYNKALHELMRDIGFSDIIRVEERNRGEMESTDIPKWKLIASHTARRSAITIAVLKGHNLHSIRKCTGHSDLRTLDSYIRDED